MDKEFQFENLENKKFIRFTSEDGTLNFLTKSIRVLIYINDSVNFDTIFIENEIIKNNQVQNSVFEFPLPINIQSIKFILSSENCDLSSIIAISF